MYFAEANSSIHSSYFGIKSYSFVKSTLSRIKPSIHTDSGGEAINLANADIFCFIAVAL